MLKLVDGWLGIMFVFFIKTIDPSFPMAAEPSLKGSKVSSSGRTYTSL
jgi:hypothetical protein